MVFEAENVMVIEDDVEEDNVGEDNGPIRRNRKKTSNVWKHFVVISLPSGVRKDKCNHCKKKLAHQSTGSTTHLKRHLTSCVPYLATIAGTSQQVISLASVEPSGKISNSSSAKFEKDKVRDVMAKMVMVHEYPFRMIEHPFFVLLCQTLNPRFEKYSRATLKSDCMRIYGEEKKKLKVFLARVNRISLTSDLWTSNQSIGYMCLTAHFLDSNWVLHKRVLNFVNMAPPHTGLMISDAIFECISQWGIENKISTITLDNASANDSAVRHLKDSFSLKGNLYFGGKIFHVRCCAHIINLMVHDGLSVIQNFISNVRETVKYLKGSPSRLHRFNEIVRQLQLPTSKRLILDVPTRWNSTYAMLECALQYRQVFPRYQERDPYYHALPSENDWEKAQRVMEFLELFNDATKVFSGVQYPTSNLFLPEIWKIKELLMLSSFDHCEYIRNMAVKMKEKFDKYWSECNLVMAIASVLDPRFKMQLIMFCFPKIYDPEFEAPRHIETVRCALYELYAFYAAKYNEQNSSASSDVSRASTSSGISIPSSSKSKGRAEFDLWASQVDNVTPMKSDLDEYLLEGRLIYSDNEPFDALQWWKTNTLKFRVLSTMARDILSIPVSTVASESTFSAGGRVVDQHRSSLKPSTVEAMICTADWLKNEFKLVDNSDADMDPEIDGNELE